MSKRTSQEQTADAYLATLEHPMKEGILELRRIIGEAAPQLAENIKWNAPNYHLNGIDCLTMRLHPPTKLQLVLHRGTALRELPRERLIEDPAGLLRWATTDRAVLTFPTNNEVRGQEEEVRALIRRWVTAVTT